MSVTRTYGQITFLCDACGADLETGTNDWQEAMPKLRRAGWQTRQTDQGVWKHHCDECVEDEMEW